jgi:CRISPR/Cas system-associated exonuclease Cas4 (RecB family)
MKNLKDSKRGGFYWKGDKPYASVTQIISIIDKPALRWWYGKQVYLAMVKDPSLQEKEALSSPYKASNKAKERGTTVHSIVEFYKIGKKIEIAKEWEGYAKAFDKWFKELNVKSMEHERSVFSEKHQFAGTLDLLVKINGDALPTVVDVKTGKEIYSEAFIQTSAYKFALEENGIKVKETAVLLLHDDGTYTYKIGADKFRGFLACKTLWELINEEDLLKVGYLK